MDISYAQFWYAIYVLNNEAVNSPHLFSLMSEEDW